MWRARTFLYTHCATALACVGSVAYGVSRYGQAWEFRLQVERLLSHPGKWPAYYLLLLSCLAFPVGVIWTIPARTPARRWAPIVAAACVLGLLQYVALDLAYPIRE